MPSSEDVPDRTVRIQVRHLEEAEALHKLVDDGSAQLAKFLDIHLRHRRAPGSAWPLSTPPSLSAAALPDVVCFCDLLLLPQPRGNMT